MERIARLTQTEKEELFSETASRKGMTAAIVEKDFWVCFLLKHLFSHPKYRSLLLFKGGTSLSKVFRLIDRFSEDIDLVLNWDVLTDEDPHAKRSRTKQDQFVEELDILSQKYIAETLLPDMNDELADICRFSIPREEPQVLLVEYPSSFRTPYVRPEVRLEIGPVAQWLPNGTHRIRTYAAEEFPALFVEPDFPVRVVSAERTFWEKATILHQEAFRPESSPPPIRYSRHYYDMKCMAESQVKENALANRELLSAVVEFKNRFYARSWARYDLAKPGTFRLLPPPHAEKYLRTDYSDMAEMIYGHRPSFDDIIAALGSLETEINS